MKKIVPILILSSALSAFISAAIATNIISKPTKGPTVTHPKPYLLLDVMQQFQRYADKVYFAAQAENIDLTAWYLWKLEQSAQAVITHKAEPWNPPSTDEVTLMQDMFIPVIQNMYDPVKQAQWDEVNALYETLVSTCNSCHEILEHGYVNIRIPERPTYSNQVFAKEP